MQQEIEINYTKKSPKVIFHQYFEKKIINNNKQ